MTGADDRIEELTMRLARAERAMAEICALLDERLTPAGSVRGLACAHTVSEKVEERARAWDMSRLTNTELHFLMALGCRAIGADLDGVELYGDLRPEERAELDRLTERVIASSTRSPAH